MGCGTQPKNISNVKYRERETGFKLAEDYLINWGMEKNQIIEYVLKKNKSPLKLFNLKKKIIWKNICIKYRCFDLFLLNN